MPIHDWRLVDAGTYHAFHGSWITHLMESLNGGLLPDGYYALAEQHIGQNIADVLTLHVPEPGPRARPHRGVAVAEAPPRVHRRLQANPVAALRGTKRTLVVREARRHRIVALIEIASPGNKDRDQSVRDFADKVDSAIKHLCHALIVDLFPPGPHDPKGLHGAIWEGFATEVEGPPPGEPLTLASYMASKLPEAFVDFVAVGEELPEMPLFLDYEEYIPLPLQPSYDAAYRGLPAFWRNVIETGKL